MNRFTVLESQNRPTINPYEEEGEERWRGGRGDKEGGVTGDAFLETLLLARGRRGGGRTSMSQPRGLYSFSVASFMIGIIDERT